MFGHFTTLCMKGLKGTLLENCHTLKEFTKQSKEKREISICNQESFSISQISLKKILETTQ